MDARRGEDFCFGAQAGFVICANTPDSLLDPERAPQREYITGYIAALENALLGPNFKDPQTGWRAFLDEASAVDYLILAEITKNVDGIFNYGPYLYKPRNDRLRVGPIWDYDITLGNVNYGDAPFLTEGWYIRNRWYGRLLQDEAFVQRVHVRWAELVDEGVISGLLARVDNRAAHLAQAQERNFHRWPILSTYVWPNRVVTGSYTGEVQALREWMQERLAWLDNEWRVERIMPGTGTGLRGTYYDNPDLAGTPRFTAVLNPSRSWPGIPGNNMPEDGWSVRWTGEFEAPTTGDYEIEVESNDRTRAWIAGTQIADAWGGPAPNTVFSTGTVRLTGGQRSPIIIDHGDLEGPSLIRVRWKLPGRVSFDPMAFPRLYPD